MKLQQNKKGQGMMEYILIAAFVVGLVVYLIGKVKEPVKTNINQVATGLSTPGN